jgi:CHRD domain
LTSQDTRRSRLQLRLRCVEEQNTFKSVRLLRTSRAKLPLATKEHTMKNIYLAALASLGLTASLGAAPALAETTSFKAMLSAAEEVPPTNSKGAGTVDVTYDSTSKKISWKGSYSGLTGNATAAHFHGPAEMGKNAGVAVALPSAASPLEGSAAVTDAQAAELMAGKMYINVHTAANPDGEIRGQLLKAK